LACFAASPALALRQKRRDLGWSEDGNDAKQYRTAPNSSQLPLFAAESVGCAFRDIDSAREKA